MCPRKMRMVGSLSQTGLRQVHQECVQLQVPLTGTWGPGERSRKPWQATGLGSCDMWEGDGGLPKVLPFLSLKHDVNYIVLSTGRSE